MSVLCQAVPTWGTAGNYKSGGAGISWVSCWVQMTVFLTLAGPITQDLIRDTSYPAPLPQRSESWAFPKLREPSLTTASTGQGDLGSSSSANAVGVLFTF